MESDQQENEPNIRLPTANAADKDPPASSDKSGLLVIDEAASDTTTNVTNLHYLSKPTETKNAGKGIMNPYAVQNRKKVPSKSPVFRMSKELASLRMPSIMPHSANEKDNLELLEQNPLLSEENYSGKMNTVKNVLVATNNPEHSSTISRQRNENINVESVPTFLVSDLKHKSISSHVSACLPAWQRLASRQISFGPAEILTLGEAHRFAGAYYHCKQNSTADCKQQYQQSSRAGGSIRVTARIQQSFRHRVAIAGTGGPNENLGTATTEMSNIVSWLLVSPDLDPGHLNTTRQNKNRFLGRSSSKQTNQPTVAETPLVATAAKSSLHSSSKAAGQSIQPTLGPRKRARTSLGGFSGIQSNDNVGPSKKHTNSRRSLGSLRRTSFSSPSLSLQQARRRSTGSILHGETTNSLVHSSSTSKKSPLERFSERVAAGCIPALRGGNAAGCIPALRGGDAGRVDAHCIPHPSLKDAPSHDKNSRMPASTNNRTTYSSISAGVPESLWVVVNTDHVQLDGANASVGSLVTVVGDVEKVAVANMNEIADNEEEETARDYPLSSSSDPCIDSAVQSVSRAISLATRSDNLCRPNLDSKVACTHHHHDVFYLRTRMVRKAEGTHMKLYEDALQMRRRFLQEQQQQMDRYHPSVEAETFTDSTVSLSNGQQQHPPPDLFSASAPSHLRSGWGPLPFR